MQKKILLGLVLSVLTVGQAHAHELWIAPEDWSLSARDTMRADILNGDDFAGSSLFWNADRTVRAELWMQDDMREIDGRLGDRPAFNIQASANGLATMLFQSTYREITYNTREKFAEFVTGKGFDAILAAHDARRLRDAPITETYVRFAKSLVAVGDGQGSDEARGLELELVALDNPYAARMDRMEIQLLYREEPLTANQVTVFMRHGDGTVGRQVMRSDAQGRVAFPLEAGVAYLVDAVVVREPSRARVAASRGAMWESLWTTLTFRVPFRGPADQ